MGCSDCFKECFEDYHKDDGIEKKIEPIIDTPNDEENNSQISNLRENLTGVTTANSLKLQNSYSSKTSGWDDSNPDHFEINIRCGHKVTKFKVKKKYTASKVITKFIEYAKPQEKLEGKLLREGTPLNATDILGELGKLENETLELI